MEPFPSCYFYYVTSVGKLKSRNFVASHIFDELPYRPDAECPFYTLHCVSTSRLIYATQAKKAKKKKNLRDKNTKSHQLGLKQTKSTDETKRLALDNEKHYIHVSTQSCTHRQTHNGLKWRGGTAAGGVWLLDKSGKSASLVGPFV